MCKKTNYFVVISITVLILLTLFGAFFDYEIANRLYFGQLPAENIFGVIFSFIGIIPTFVGWAFLGASIIYLSKKQIESTIKRRLFMAFSVLLFILSFFYFCNTIMMVNANAFSVHWGIAYPIGIAVIIGASFLGYKMAQKSQNPNLLATLFLLALVSIITMIIIMSTKEIMDRPRFRWVLKMNNPEFFKNFWESGSAIKASLNLNVVSDEFSSFPSGHSAYSMFAIFLFPAISDFFPKLEKYRSLFFAFGFIWWALTALSRLTVGAHYLTDVSIAATITILAYIFVYVINRKCRKHKN
jgi:membrane-associated phospholipid phosphatase